MPIVVEEENIVAYMSKATSEVDWLLRAGAVLRGNGGEYPDFWESKVEVLLDKLTREWAAQSDEQKTYAERDDGTGTNTCEHDVPLDCTCRHCGDEEG